MALTSSAVRCGAVVEFAPPAQKERIGFAIWRDLPTVRQVWDDGLAAVQRITPDQIVVHTAIACPYYSRCPTDVDIEKVRWRARRSCHTVRACTVLPDWAPKRRWLKIRRCPDE